MFYKIAADFLLLVHFLWIVFLILGLPFFLFLNFPRLRLFHGFSLLATLGMQIAKIECPLTPAEEGLRLYQDPHFSYGGSFLITHLERIVYIQGISPRTITILTSLLLLATLISFFLKPIQRKSPFHP